LKISVIADELFCISSHSKSRYSVTLGVSSESLVLKFLINDQSENRDTFTIDKGNDGLSFDDIEIPLLTNMFCLIQSAISRGHVYIDRIS
jgi:hypothetical protein